MKASATERRIVIFLEGDFTLRESGSHIRFAEQIEFLSENFDDVVVYSYLEHATKIWNTEAISRFNAQFPGISLVLDHRYYGLRLLTKLKNVALSIMPGLAARAIASG